MPVQAHGFASNFEDVLCADCLWMTRYPTVHACLHQRPTNHPAADARAAGIRRSPRLGDRWASEAPRLRWFSLLQRCLDKAPVGMKVFPYWAVKSGHGSVACQAWNAQQALIFEVTIRYRIDRRASTGLALTIRRRMGREEWLRAARLSLIRL